MAISSERSPAPGSDAPGAATSADHASAPDGSERRQHVRQELELDAVVGVLDGPSRACLIQDFCPGGLFLSFDGAGEIAIGDKPLERFDELVVQFSAPVRGKEQAFEVDVLVARVVAGGVGVSFQGKAGAAIHALNHALNETQQAGKDAAAFRGAKQRVRKSVGDVADASHVLDTYRNRVVAYLESNLAALFDQARDELFTSARDADDREAQRVLFDAIQELDGLKESAQTAFLESMNEQLRKPGARNFSSDSTASQTSNLDVALVDTGTFDDWVVVKDIISRANGKYAERQAKIGTLLSKVLNVDIDDDTNPVGLTGIGLTFHDAMQNLGAGHECRQALLQAFEASIVAGLGTLYDDLVQILSDRDAGSAEEFTGGDTSGVGAPDDQDSSAESRDERSPEPAHAGEAKPAGGTGIDPAGIKPPPVVVGDLLHTARSLLMLERQAKMSDNLPAALSDLACAQPVPPPPMGSKSLDQVIDALSILQRSPKFSAIDEKGPLALKERLMTTWRAAGLRVADGEGDAVEVISNLLDAILEDPLVQTRVKSCVRRLAIALVKVALQDKEFFNDEEHPARRLINQLGRVEIAPDGSVTANGAWQTTIDPLIDRIVHGYEKDPLVFTQVLVEFEKIVNRQEQRLSENVSKLVQERNQQQALLDARRGPNQPESMPASDAGASNVPTEWKRWLARVELLQAGDAVFLDKNEERPEKLNLVWVSDKRDSYLFASGCGEKTSTLTQQELAMHFRRGAARVLDDFDLPVVDRGMFRLLNALHARLAKKASHDGVTGTLNRKAFESALGQTASDAVRMGTSHVLCVLEIDEFRTIVEKCGRKAGKGLLRKLARVLEKHLGSKGIVGRLTKGRFAMLLNSCELEDGRKIVDRQRKSMEKSRCVWQGESFQLTISVGMVLIDAQNKATVAELIETAGEAFDEAHREGGNRIQTRETPVLEAVSAGTSVLQMLAENRLQLRCQKLAPIGADTTAKPYFELLLGVMDESGAITMPRDFIQSAERNNEMHEVDMWVIRNALDWMAKHRSKVDAVGGYSINLSGLTLGDDSLLRYVLERLTESQVPPSKVIFELTESAAIDTLSAAVTFINTLKEYGCRFALDDFGTGDASFAYLKTLPIDFVKIDGSIVKDVVESPKDLALVKSINEIGHFMGKKTVAEFVENDEVLARLRQIGVDYAQGYGIEAPFVLS